MNYSYDELKEDVWNKFNDWYYKMGVSEESMVDLIMDHYTTTIEVSKAEKLCILTFLFLIYMKKDLYSKRIPILMNDLLIDKEEIQQDLREDYDRLLKEIDFIMDKYWRRVEVLSVDELMILYRRQVTADAKNIIDKVVQEENITVEDSCFYGATRKIEYALQYSDDTIIFVSLVDDLSYDFTVWDEDLSKIIYNNTQILLSVDDLYDSLRNDLKRQKG